jgi:hypothetical protein
VARGGIPGNRGNPHPVGNRNPVAGRLAQKARAKPGDLADVQALLWAALDKAQGVMEASAQKDDMVLRAANCIGQLAMSYAKLLEIGETEARLQAVEAALKRLQEEG